MLTPFPGNRASFLIGYLVVLILPMGKVHRPGFFTDIPEMLLMRLQQLRNDLPLENDSIMTVWIASAASIYAPLVSKSGVVP